MYGIKYTISKRIKEARTARGISREKLLDEINKDLDRPLEKGSKIPKCLSFETYRRWEDGTNAVNVEWIPVLCRHLYCDVGYLYGEYECRTRQATDVHEVTGLSENAIRVLSNLKRKAPNATIVQNIIDTVNMLIENADEEKSEYEVVPLLEHLSAYLNCAPTDERIVSVEVDGSVSVYANRAVYEAEEGEVLVGDYMRRIIKTRMESRVMDELKNMWNEKNGESRAAFIQRMIEESRHG